MTQIKNAFVNVFGSKRSYLIFLLSSFLFFLFFLIFPTLPNKNNAYAQTFSGWSGYLMLSLKTIRTSLLLSIILLSLGIGLVLTFQIYVWKMKKDAKNNLSSVTSSGSFFGVIVTTLFSTFSCVSCFGSVLTIFLPTSGLIFLSNYRIHIIALSFALILLSLYLNIRTINGYCERCVY